jgi:hypothetical protein
MVSDPALTLRSYFFRFSELINVFRTIVIDCFLGSIEFKFKLHKCRCNLRQLSITYNPHLEMFM